MAHTVNPEIFARIFFSRIAFNDINSRQGHVLHLSVDDRVISPFLEGFIFTNFLKGDKNIKLMC